MSNSFVTPWIVACQALLSMGLFRQESWDGLSFPSPGDLLHPGINPTFPASAGADSLPLSHQGSLIGICYLGDWSGKLTFLCFLGITNISMTFIILPWLSQESYFTIWKSLFCFYTSKNTLTISLFCLF